MNQLKYTLYFIPECSKCRGSLNLLEKFDENLLKKINYVENPPNEEELKKISSIIDGGFTSLLREDSLKNLQKENTEINLNRVLKLILNDPKSNLQRPIFINWEKNLAVVARPVEKINDLL